MIERQHITPLRCFHLEAYWSSLPVRGIGNKGCNGHMLIKMYGWDERQNRCYQTLVCNTCGEHAPDVPTIDSADVEDEYGV